MAQNQIIECVPNFSEGRDPEKIKQITGEIERIEGVRLLDVDPGKATNRTVVTLAGDPEAVIEAAFRAVKKAAEVIDMRHHHGEHPRMGATDVCPLVPVANITMEETVAYARKLAQRIGEELEIPVYCYEYAAFNEERRNLATIRAGEYEALPAKLQDARWKPDFGPAKFNPGAGATVVGARDFLVAYNINLNTTSTRRANAVAFDVRERGRVKREGDPLTGKMVKDDQGNPVYIPGSLKSVKAIGWYIEEYGIAQISMNLTNLSVTPLHVAFDEVCRRADARGLRVTGSELVGLIPLKSLLDAGRYFLKKQKRSTGLPEEELIRMAVKSLGLDELYPFKPEEKIIEYRLAGKGKDKLAGMTLKGFMQETASESPAPGGGSVSAYLSALGAALGTMVANLSAHKRGWDDRWEEFSDWADQGTALQKELLALVDEDTRAFNRIMEAYKMPAGTPEEKKLKQEALNRANLEAVRVPARVVELSEKVLPLLKAMVQNGNPASVSDAGVGALAVMAGAQGAFLNVRINGIHSDDPNIRGILKESEERCERIEQETAAIYNLTNKKIEES